MRISRRPNDVIMGKIGLCDGVGVGGIDVEGWLFFVDGLNYM